MNSGAVGEQVGKTLALLNLATIHLKDSGIE